MNPDRRRLLAAGLASPLLLPALARSQTSPETPIRINIPGPRSLPFLPVDLIPLLGFDREMRTRVIVRYHPSGVRGIEDVLAGNADLAALGFSTLPVLAARGKDVVAISPLSGRTPPVAIVIRKDLADSVRRIADLKGRTIGTATGSINSKTYLQMSAEVVLGAHGVKGNEVRWLPTAQSWESISGVIASKAADAVFCEEPFSSRLLHRGLGLLLADLGDPRVAQRVPGFNHVRTAIVTSRALARSQPERMELFVRVLRRTLVWIQASPPELVAQKAPVSDAAERAEIAALLRKMPGIYNPDGRFVAEQIAATDVFLRAAVPEARLLPAAGFIDDRWAGIRA